MKTISMICTLAAALMTGAGCSGQEQPKVSVELFMGRQYEVRRRADSEGDGRNPV